MAPEAVQPVRPTTSEVNFCAILAPPPDGQGDCVALGVTMSVALDHATLGHELGHEAAERRPLRLVYAEFPP
jgi:hypothetical protein